MCKAFSFLCLNLSQQGWISSLLVHKTCFGKFYELQQGGSKCFFIQALFYGRTRQCCFMSVIFFYFLTVFYGVMLFFFLGQLLLFLAVFAGLMFWSSKQAYEALSRRHLPNVAEQKVHKRPANKR